MGGGKVEEGRGLWKAPGLGERCRRLPVAVVAARAAGTVALRAGFVDGQRPALQVAAVQALDGGLRLVLVVHLDEAEAPRFAGEPVGDDADTVNPCTVRFECNGMSGEPVSWTVDVAPKTIFSYWPNKTANGTSSNLQAALMEAGKTEEEARRRTTCEVFSPAPVAVRSYTLFGGQPTLVPVAIY